jgi:sugar phosphate isomerase/epimerase
MARVGLMLYGVREDCARDFAGTLRDVAAMGYEGVELFDLHGYPAARVRGWLDELGLDVAGRHVSLSALDGDLSSLAEEAEALGSSRVVLGWVEPPRSRADAESHVRQIADRAAEAAALGLELGFHNHDAELRDLGGRTMFDDLLELPIYLELDLGWAWWAAVDPVSLLERARGRVPLVHVKDFRVRGERSFCPVGDGGVGYERVAPVAVAAGVEWLLVEQDEADGSALEAARRSHDALRSMLEEPPKPEAKAS